MIQNTTTSSASLTARLNLALQRMALWLGISFLSMLVVACGGGGSGAEAPLPAEPTLTMSSNAGEEASEPFVVTFAFSAPVQVNHPSGILQVATANCSAITSTFAQTGPATYTMVFNPAANRQGIAKIHLAAGTFKDSTGTVTSTRSYDFAQPINTIGPVANYTDTAGLFITGPTTVTISFDSVLDAALSIDKLTVSVGSVSNLVKTSAVGSNDTYTFTYTPPAATLGSVIIQLPRGSVASGAIQNASAQQWGPRGIKTP